LTASSVTHGGCSVVAKVEVENGWVTMSGMVDRPYQRTCAESDARRVPGVIGVNNHIRLEPAQAEQGSVSH
jgi:osmotically-inducible protein OsmY